MHDHHGKIKVGLEFVDYLCHSMFQELILRIHGSIEILYQHNLYQVTGNPINVKEIELKKH